MAMQEHEFKQVNFDKPSLLFVLEDGLKSLIGEPLLYKPYFTTFGLQGDETVLDFGCGGGVGSRCLRKLLTSQGHLTCVDTSDFWINKATKRLKKYANVECKAGDIRELDIPDNTYDVISIFHVIHDIAPAERQDIINALSRKLKGNGKLLIREPIKESHGMPVEEIRTLLSNAGLQETEHKVTKSDYMGKYQKPDPGNNSSRSEAQARSPN
jgi:ubiquinone/menaquinone biosynthesis C-methylase UbiE